MSRNVHTTTKIAIIFHKYANFVRNLCSEKPINQTLDVAKKKKRTSSGVDPEYLKKQKEALVRKHRQVIYLNDSELAAINLYCERFRVGTKAVLYREAIMEKILSELDDTHPTLF